MGCFHVEYILTSFVFLSFPNLKVVINLSAMSSSLDHVINVDECQGRIQELSIEGGGGGRAIAIFLIDLQEMNQDVYRIKNLRHRFLNKNVNKTSLHFSCMLFLNVTQIQHWQQVCLGIFLH